MHFIRTVSLAVAACGASWCQGNYEVQVYGSKLVPRGATMFELHSNYTAHGMRTVVAGVLPSNHAVHETLEITHGFHEWFETGLYQFNSFQPGHGWMWVGTHVRPRFAVPERYGLPVGLSLSNEIGYQRPAFAANTWTWEMRPIVDKKLDRWYGSFNPVLDRSLRGPDSGRGFVFSPNFKVSYDVTKRIAAGLEYYGAYGPLFSWDPLRNQQQMFLPAVDVDFGPDWEFNFGVGWGVTQATDRLLVKMILGYRFGAKKKGTP